MHKPILLTLALAALALSAGCATSPGHYNPAAKLPPPAKPHLNLRPPQPTVGSLFVSARADISRDIRAARVGDIVVVQVVENSKANKKSDSKAERTNEYSAAIPNLLGMEIRRNKSIPGGLVKADLTSKHDATSEIKKEDTMTTSITCTVIEVLLNNNLVIRGSREVRVNGETQYVILQGVIRPEDITTQNTVTSNQVADAKIFYTGRGVLTDKMRPGWLARLLDNVWPF